LGVDLFDAFVIGMQAWGRYEVYSALLARAEPS
jgi:hypothetical protein